MKIPQKMIQEFNPIVTSISFQPGFSDSISGGSYIYKNDTTAHIGARLIKSEEYISSGESMFYVGENFLPKMILDGQSSRYLQGYALAEDDVKSVIGTVLVEINNEGLAIAYFQTSLADSIKCVVIPEQQYIL